MLSEEEKKAIERIEDTFYQDNGKGIKGFQKIILYEDGIIDILKLLNIVEKLQKEDKDKELEDLKEIKNIADSKITDLRKIKDYDKLQSEKWILQTKLQQKDKQIDLMAEMIDELSEYYTRCRGKNNEFCKENCIKEDIDCIDCIKQYFETKAKEE